MYFVLAAVIFSSIAQDAHGKHTRCPLTILTDMSGEIKSTGYPDEPYPNNHRCRTVIEGHKGYIIEILFKDFQLEKAEEGKRADFLKVIDGRPGKNVTQTLVYNGSSAKPSIFLSKSSRVTLFFSTNGMNREKGFYATYRQLKANFQRIDTPITIPPPAPPSTEPPREPESPHPYDETIAICSKRMEDCPWSADELVSKITESLNIDTSIEFNGEGDPGVPVLDPRSVVPTVLEGSSLPGQPPVEPVVLVPEKCYPFGRKYSSTKAYVISCRAYLSNTALKYYYQRRNAMIACYKCRKIIEQIGEFTFL